MTTLADLYPPRGYITDEDPRPPVNVVYSMRAARALTCPRFTPRLRKAT